MPPGDSLPGRRESQPAPLDRRRGARRRRWSRRARRSPTRWRASRPIRSRSRSCGAGSSPWSTRCGSTVIRTAFSLIISEAQDFACELLDAKGEPLVHSPRAMPVFNLCLPRAVKALLAKYPPETLRARRRAGHQRSVALRRASVRHRGAYAGVPRRPPRRPRRHGRPRQRHRRHQGLAEGARDLRGGHPDPADEAVPRGRAERGPVHAARRERAQSRAGARRRAFLRGGERGRRRAPDRVHERIRHPRSRSARRGAAGPLREGDARGDRRDAGRRLHLGGLEQSARHAAALSGQAHRQGRHHRGRFRGRAAAAAAGRAQLHAQLHAPRTRPIRSNAC